MAVVFVYGGVAPEDVVNGYIVLIATALGLGSFGLFCSSLVKRTTAATAVTIFGVLFLTIGTGFLLVFWAAMGTFDNNGNRTNGPFGIKAPVVLAYVNPFLAQADILCGTEATFGGMWCSGVQTLAPTNAAVVFVENGDGGSSPAACRSPFPAPCRPWASARTSSSGPMAVSSSAMTRPRRRWPMAGTRCGRRASRPGSSCRSSSSRSPCNSCRRPVASDFDLVRAVAGRTRREHVRGRRLMPSRRRGVEATPTSWSRPIRGPCYRRPWTRRSTPSGPRSSPHRRRLWLRRIVRRAWVALAVLAVAEAILWTIARFFPLEAAPVIGVAIPVLVALGLLVAIVRARPSLGETALAVDMEGGLGDRVSSALELAVAFPASAGPAPRRPMVMTGPIG